MSTRLAVIACILLSVVSFGGCSSSESIGELADARQAAVVPTVARGNIHFIQGYDRGQEEAQRTGKPMMLFFTASWCRYCHEMEAEAFTVPQAVELAQRFTCVLIDADEEASVCRMFHVSGYPTIQFISPGGAPLNRIIGKQPGQQLIMEMHAALQAIARRAGQATEAVRR